MDQKYFFDAIDFVYPTQEEKARIIKSYPLISAFGFSYQQDTIEQLMYSVDWKKISVQENLFWWDNCLVSRLGNLQNAYLNAVTHFDRTLNGEVMVSIKVLRVADFQFKFYMESFYYFYFSTRDIIMQIINLYFNVSLNENEVTEARLIQSVDLGIQKIMKKFRKEVREASEIRNSLTHRFPINRRDNRSRVIVAKDKMVFESGGGHSVLPGVIVLNMNASLVSLQQYLEELKNEFKL